jgi:hypothetical protein
MSAVWPSDFTEGKAGADTTGKFSPCGVSILKPGPNISHPITPVVGASKAKIQRSATGLRRRSSGISLSRALRMERQP